MRTPVMTAALQAAGALLLINVLQLSTPALATTVKLCVTVGPPTVAPIGALPAVGTTWVGADVANHLQGIGIDLALSVFGQLLPGYNYTTTYVGGFSQMLYQTRVGICDVAVDDIFQAYSRAQCVACATPPSDTSGFTSDFDWEDFACCIDFSHSYFSGGWSLMTLAAQDSGQVDVFSIISQKSIIQAVCYATLLTFAIAHVIWLCERTVFDDQVQEVAPSYLYPRKYFDGLREATWFASSTAMSNALHNKTIVTGPGRLVAAVWVAFGMFLTAFVTSIFSSTLTTQQLEAVTITSADDMAGRSLCIESGFYNIFWDLTFPAIGVRKTFVDNVASCVPLVLSGKVDAAFSIRVYFISYFATGLGAGLAVTPVVAPQSYSIAWGRNFTGRKDVNTAILQWIEGDSPATPLYKASVSRWYGGDAGVFVYGSGTQTIVPWDKPLIISTCVILGIYMLLQGVVILGAWAHRHFAAEDGDSSMLDVAPSMKSSRSHLGLLANIAKASAMLSSDIDTQVMKRSRSHDVSGHSGGGGVTFGSTSGYGGGGSGYGSGALSGSNSAHSGPLKLVSALSAASASGDYGSRRHSLSAVAALGSHQVQDSVGGHQRPPPLRGGAGLGSPFSRVDQKASFSQYGRNDVQLTLILPISEDASAGGGSLYPQQQQQQQQQPVPLKNQSSSLQALLQQAAALAAQQAALTAQQADVQAQVAQLQQLSPPATPRDPGGSGTLLQLLQPTSVSQVTFSPVGTPRGNSWTGQQLQLLQPPSENISDDQLAHLVDEVVSHLGEVTRVQIRTQVHEAMLLQKAASGVATGRDGMPSLRSERSGVNLAAVAPAGMSIRELLALAEA